MIKCLDSHQAMNHFYWNDKEEVWQHLLNETPFFIAYFYFAHRI